MRIFVTLIGLGVAASAVAAPAPADHKPSKNKKEGLICRTVDEIGSRLSNTRICMTREQWEASRREAKDTLQQMRSLPKSGH